MPIKNKIKAVAKIAFRAVYPCRCLCCGRLIEAEGLCYGCEALMKRTSDNVCPQCARPTSECECWRIKPRLDGFAAPFYNIGRANIALYRFKFGGAKEGASFFGKRMAECFKKRFEGVRIDAVCCVPDAHRSKAGRGYYTAYALGKMVARELELPFRPDLLIQIKSSRPQHSLDFKERLINVKGIYEAAKDVKGKNILVVDDIRTSGATLNECGRTLKKARAAKVYGLAATLSRNLQ